MIFAFGISGGRAAILAAALCGVLALASCGDDPVRPAPSTGPAYRSALPQQVQDQLAMADRIRALDPCGFVDRPAAAALGTVDYVGAGPWPSDGDIDQCDVVFDPAVESPPISIQLSLSGTPAGKQVQVGDTTVYVGSGYGCRAVVPVESMTVTYAGAHDCAALMRVVSASVPLLRNRPARQASKLTKLDPCEVLAHASGMGSGPYPPVTGLAGSCRTDTEEIVLGYLDSGDAPKPGVPVIDGIPVAASPDPADTRNCVASVYFGFGEPHTIPHGKGAADLVFEEFGSITGFGRDCESVKSDAARLVASYRHVS